MNYEIIFNIPNEKEITKVEITQEQLSKLEEKLNSRSIIKIGDSYYNTAYIVKIIPKKERVVLNDKYFLEIKNEKRIPENINAELEKLKKKVKITK